MKLKSLLLASGAALIAVSGARAADPVVVPEPEPVEYVRVCDAAGTGYFYIPGTETCLQISGEVIYKIGFRDQNAIQLDDDGLVFTDEQDGWEKEYEISLDFKTWRDTEFGDLTTQIQLGASSSTIEEDAGATLGDDDVAVNEAFITLGGLTIGYTDSFYPGGKGASDLDSEGPDTGVIGYTVDFGNGSFGIALEDDGNDDWTPAVVGVASADIGDISAAAAAYYDDTDEAWGAQLHLTYDSGPFGIAASVQYSDVDISGGAGDDNTPASAYANLFEWVLSIGADYDVSDQLNVYAGLDYGIDSYTDINGNDARDNLDVFLVEVGASYEVVDGFSIGVEADFSDYRVDGNDEQQFGFEDAEITFTRSF